MLSSMIRTAGATLSAVLLLGALVLPALASELRVVMPRTDLMLVATDLPGEYQRTAQSVSTEAGTYELQTFVRAARGVGPRSVLNATMQFNTRLSDADIADTAAGFISGLRSAMKPGTAFSEPAYLDARDLGDLARLVAIKIQSPGEEPLDVVAAVFSRDDVLSIVSVTGDEGRTATDARHFARLLDARVGAPSTAALR